MILFLLEIPKDNKLNEKTAHLNQETLENCDQVKDVTKAAEKDDIKGPKAAEKDATKEPKEAEKDDRKEPKAAEKLKKDEKYLESLREKAKE